MRILLVLSMIVFAVSVCFAQVELTIYNQGYALVKDVRNISVNKGVENIEFSDVSAQIEPQSVLLKSLTDSSSFSILEQNYRYDLMNSSTILNKLIGERVILEDGTEGTLLSAPGLSGTSVNAGVIVQKDDGNIVLHPVIKETKKMPAGLIARPTLSWLIDSKAKKNHTCELSYITQGVTWSSDYVLLVNKDDTLADISGWVTVDNRCGTSFDDAEIALIAGDVERKADMAYPQEMKAAGMVAMSAPMMKNDFKEESFFEYHLYKLDRKSDVLNNESKQLALLSKSNVKVVKKLTYAPRMRSLSYISRLDPENAKAGFSTRSDIKVNVTLELMNSKENNMGMPLPKGTVKVYKLDSSGSQQFIGEDRIDHTPKDEKIDLFLGSAFDVTGTYSMTDFKINGNDTFEETYQVKLSNHKDTEVTVDVYENVWGDWKVIKSDVENKKIDASTICFPVTIPADSAKTITYTIRTKI